MHCCTFIPDRTTRARWQRLALCLHGGPSWIFLFFSLVIFSEDPARSQWPGWSLRVQCTDYRRTYAVINTHAARRRHTTIQVGPLWWASNFRPLCSWVCLAAAPGRHGVVPSPTTGITTTLAYALALLYSRTNCKTALILKPNYMFAPIFLTLHVCPCF